MMPTFTILAACSLLSIQGEAKGAERDSHRPPNVVLILADDK